MGPGTGQAEVVRRRLKVRTKVRKAANADLAAFFSAAVPRDDGDTVLAMNSRLSKLCAWGILVSCAASAALAQTPAATTSAQTETDEYTRYELLSPDSASFAIRYEVTATTAGAKYFFNPIRKGSVASGESVVDSMSGQPLRFEVVSGEQAAKDPLMKGEDSAMDYIKVYLARPVPPEGQARLLIMKTYKDAKSYYREGDTIVFNRPLGVRRNSVELPAGYELVACNVPSQVLAEPDGRIAISFMNAGGAQAPLIVKAKPGAQTGAQPRHTRQVQPRAGSRPSKARLRRSGFPSVPTRTATLFTSSSSRKRTPSASITITPSRSPGVDKYFNVVRTGSMVSDPSAYILDTGEKLAPQIMTGAELAAAKIDAGEPVPPAAQVVVIPILAGDAGRDVRLTNFRNLHCARKLSPRGDTLVFDRSLGRPRNAVVFPEGWYLTASSIPATVTQMADGRHPAGFLEWTCRRG